MAVVKNATPSGKRIEYRKFVQADVDSNHNKFWNVGLYDSGDVEIHFGRIGVTENQCVEFGGGRSYMEKKIRSKERGKMKDGKREYYRELKTLDGDFPQSKGQPLKSRQLKNIARDQIDHSSPETAKLIEWLAEINRHNILNSTTLTYNVDSGLFQTPMGIVTPDSISQARSLLVDIGDYVDRGNYGNSAFRNKVNDYLMLVPQNVGMKLKIEHVFPDLAAVQKQGQILDSLDASYASATTTSQDDKKDDVKQSKVFETKLILVQDSKISAEVNKLFTGSRNRNHYAVYGMKIRQIWSVEITAMKMAFETISSKIGNVVRLWHGTQASNCLSILKGGLVIPPASSSHVTGRMYGDGVYASSQSTKALNYATSFWGGRDVGRYFMFLLDMAMGKAYIPGQANYGYTSGGYPKRGYDSTWAKPGSGVRNDERIVYKTSQVNLKFLVEFRK